MGIVYLWCLLEKYACAFIEIHFFATGRSVNKSYHYHGKYKDLLIEAITFKATPLVSHTTLKYGFSVRPLIPQRNLQHLQGGYKLSYSINLLSTCTLITFQIKAFTQRFELQIISYQVWLTASWIELWALTYSRHLFVHCTQQIALVLLACGYNI